MCCFVMQCFALLSLYALLPIAVGAKLPRIYCKSTAMDARSTRASRPSTWSARNPMQVFQDRIGTIVMIFINAGTMTRR